MPKKLIKPSSAAILGNITIIKKEPTKCIVCSKEIPSARIKALKSINTPSDKWTHVQCSTVTKIKGLYMGEVGTSQLQLCDKVYNDSVRSVFRKAELDLGVEDGDLEDDI